MEVALRMRSQIRFQSVVEGGSASFALVCRDKVGSRVVPRAPTESLGCNNGFLTLRFILSYLPLQGLTFSRCKLDIGFTKRLSPAYPLKCPADQNVLLFSQNQLHIFLALQIAIKLGIIGITIKPRTPRALSTRPSVTARKM